MKTSSRQHKHNLFISVVTLLLCSQAIAFAQSTQIVPENLRSYCQFEANNITDCNGPVIGEISTVAGCWINKTTGDWTIGLFEKFAVYQSRFWDYESIKTNKNKCTVILKSGKEQIAIQMKRKDENNCTITFGKSKPQEHTLCSSQYLPDYPQTDHTPFADNGYTEDSVTIIGYFRNPPSTKPFNVTVPDMIKGKEIKFDSEIDSLGRFTLRFPVLNTHNVFIDWGRTTIWTSVEPGKTYFLFTDFSSGQKLFMGKDVRFQNERLAYRELGVYIPFEEGNRMSNPDFFHQTLKNYQLEKNQLDAYISNHPNLSQRFRYYSEQALRYSVGCALMQRRFNVDRSNKEELDKEFMNYVDSALVPDPVQPYTLLRDYSFFIRDYMGYIDNISPHSPKINILSTESIKKSLEKLERNGKITLTKEDRNDLDAWGKMYQEIMRLLATRPDSTTLANFQKPYEPLLKRIDKLQSSDAWNEYIQSFPKRSSFDSMLLTLDIIPMDTALKEILTTQQFYKILDDSHAEMPDSLLARLKTLVTNPYLVNCVQQQQNIYKSIAIETAAHSESLKSNESLIGITDGKELLKKIIEPYKGKVIYLDIWGTWCGPCKALMQFAGKTKKLFEGKDVIFLYLANNSPELSWKNIIKEYELTGSVSVHYNLPYDQQRAIESFLGVSYFPTYVLIDKEGNVVSTKAPRPDQESELINAVWNELGKK